MGAIEPFLQNGARPIATFLNQIKSEQISKKEREKLIRMAIHKPVKFSTQFQCYVFGKLDGQKEWGTLCETYDGFIRPKLKSFLGDTKLTEIEEFQERQESEKELFIQNHSK